MAMASLRLLRLERCCRGFLMRSNTLAASIRAHHHHHHTSTQPPRLMLPPAFDGHGNMAYQMYNLSQDRVETLKKNEQESESGEIKIVGSSHGWLALFNPHTNNLFLSNPFTLQHINLPPLHTLLADAQGCIAVSKLILSCSPSSDKQCLALMSFRGPDDRLPNRLAFCLPADITESKNKGEGPRWTLINSLKHKEEDEEFDESYNDEFRDDQQGTCYHDLVYSTTHKLFFCITNYNHLQAWDFEYPWEPIMVLSCFIEGLTVNYINNDHEHRYGYRDPSYFMLQKYLVFDDRSDQLFLVRRPVKARVSPEDGRFVRPVYYGYRRGWSDTYPYKTIGFHVHKIDDGVKWRRKKARATYVKPGGSLDGLAMFVGLNQSFALSAAEFPELKPNSIYFTDNISTTSDRGDWHEEIPCSQKWVDRAYGGHDLGIFNYEDRTFSPRYYPCDVQSIKRIAPAPIWITPS